MSPTIRLHADQRALRAALIALVETTLTEAVAERGQAVIAVSGGKSPVPLFEALAETDLPWSNVTVTLVDERLLPTSHEDSNEHLVRTHLLKGRASAARFVGLRGTAPGLEAAAAAADRAIADLPAAFDLVVLGMGEDGHTASWFKDGDRLDQALDPAGTLRVIAMVAESAAACPERLTLTLPVVAAARLVVLPVEGEGKLATLARALADGPEEDLPIRAALRHSVIQIHRTR